MIESLADGVGMMLLFLHMNNQSEDCASSLLVQWNLRTTDALRAGLLSLGCPYLGGWH